MKFGIAIRKNYTDYFIHKSYILMLEKYNHSFGIITLNSNLNEYDAFLLPGGDDINPTYYNQKNYACNNIDLEIDFLDKKIIEYAYNNKKPLLGICRGIQSINVFLGGTLKQNILNHSNENHFIFFNNKKILVNSFHHQSIDKLAPNFNILAKSIDNEIEIIKHNSLPIIGIQFHPELFDFDMSIIFNEF